MAGIRSVFHKLSAFILISVLVCMQDGVEPTISEVQGGFQRPNFIVSPEVLSEVDLFTKGGDDSLRFHLYNRSLRTWIKIKPGHVVSVLDNRPVFLKAINVTNCGSQGNW
jgi:hypothetical protein